jgi:hypothetical protein
VAEELAKVHALDTNSGNATTIDPDLAIKLQGKDSIPTTKEERMSSLRVGVKGAGLTFKTAGV